MKGRVSCIAGNLLRLATVGMAQGSTPSLGKIPRKQSDVRWPAPRKTPRVSVEFVTERRRTDEGEPIQRRANHWDFARDGGRTEDRGGVSAPRHRRGDALQVEGEVRRDGGGRCEAAQGTRG